MRFNVVFGLRQIAHRLSPDPRPPPSVFELTPEPPTLRDAVFGGRHTPLGEVRHDRQRLAAATAEACRPNQFGVPSV
jgi:hypothetical protein